jgi:branched-chain amino acid transport system ATP-binding protein
VPNQDVAGGSSISREYAFSLNGSTLAPGERLLEIADIDLRFGGIQALDGVGLTVAQGEIHSIIGPNGAGKSSLINCVSGLYRPQQGRITLHRRGGSAELVGRKPHEIARAHSATIRVRGARATLPLNPPTRSTT